MAYLVLSNGKIFEGERIGAVGDSIGEVVFTTEMVGYVEALSDPAFKGQTVVMTFSMLGNYGVCEEDVQGECALSGVVLREVCDAPSNFRCDCTLDAFLKKNGVVGICGVDTRALTKILREGGSLNGIICDEIPSDLTFLKNYSVADTIKQSAVKKRSVFCAKTDKKYSVAVIDYGTRKSVTAALCERGCEVTLLPADSTAEEVLALSPDGVLLSGGTDYYAFDDGKVCEVKKLIGRVPMLALGVGHLILGRAAGGEIYRMPCGHRGANQPVSKADGSRTYITSQNHGFALCADKADGKILFKNANDGSCEGMEYPNKYAISTQFYPDAESTPVSTAFIYDTFISMMGGDADA